MLKTRDKQIYEEAAEWLVDLRVGDMDAAAHEQLDAWFRESPHHIRAFLELSAIWEETEGADLGRGKSTEALIAAARASTNVIQLAGEGVASDRQEPGPSHRPASHKPRLGILTLAKFFVWPSGVLAAVVLACLSLGLIPLNVYWNNDYVKASIKKSWNNDYVQPSIKKSTNIPAQELASALKTLAHERGFNVAFLGEVVGTKRTQGAVGDLTTTEALARLLEGTNLAYSYPNEKTVTILPVNSNNKLDGTDSGRGDRR